MSAVDLAPSRTRIKSAVSKRAGAGKSTVTWPEVLRALPGDQARSRALTLYRAAEFGPNDFSGSRKARIAMADALTRTEDFIELDGADTAGRRADRQRIRDVRRRLEWELWP